MGQQQPILLHQPIDALVIDPLIVGAKTRFK